MVKVAVLGCGPAGLMAAQAFAAEYQGALDMRIFSRKSKSPLYGAQYLHEPIPGFTPSDAVTIDYQLAGTAEGYAMKVYGPQFSGRVSPQDLGFAHSGWDLRTTYDALWWQWQNFIDDQWITPMWLHSMREEYKPDIIIGSINRQTMCVAGHYFASTEVIVAGDAPPLGIRIPYSCPDATVICNGEPDVSWYRVSNIFDHKTVEWPSSIGRAPLNSAATVRKPISTNCDCWPEVHWVGRYGKWAKGVLSHEAYGEAQRIAWGLSS